MALQNEHYNNNFDFLRFWAASFVVWIHCFELLKLPIEGDPFMQLTKGSIWLSSFGLYIFFFISGLLITKSMNSSKSIMDYIWKRFLRIWPGLITCMVLCTFALGLFFTNMNSSEYLANKGTWTFLGKNIILFTDFFLPGVFMQLPNHVINGPLYSLIYEVQCYVIVLILGILAINKRAWPYWLIYVSSWLLFIVFKAKPELVPLPLRYYIPFSGIDLKTAIDFNLFFFAGALYMQYGKLIPKNWKLAVGVLVLYLAMCWIPATNDIAKYIGLPYLIYYLSYMPAPKWINEWAKKGDYSFGIYIYGMPISQIVIATMGVSTATEYVFVFVSIAWILSILLGFISWNVVEKRALAYKNLFAKKK